MFFAFARHSAFRVPDRSLMQRDYALKRMTGDGSGPRFAELGGKEVIMQALLWILTALLALPLLLVVAVALGPAILVVLFVLAWSVPVLLAVAWSRHTRRTKVPPMTR